MINQLLLAFNISTLWIRYIIDGDNGNVSTLRDSHRHIG